ncbi:50S ribosomal protein L15 [Candidatus Omnitrophota bacterium]
MMSYLKVPKGAKSKRKRRGRGQGSGHGKTACRGHKGQQARGSTKKGMGFEGGQMPILRRIPKRGFTNKFRVEYQIVNIKNLASLKADLAINPTTLKEKGLIKYKSKPLKILGDGKLNKGLEVHAHAFSKSAKEAIEQANGKAVVIKK